MFAFLATLASMTIANAATFRLVPLDAGDPKSTEIVLLQGPIERGDYDKLRAFAKTDTELFHARTFVLASRGGDILEAMKIGKLLRRLFASAFVSLEHGECASACFLIYVAAVERSAMVPTLGIHRPYIRPSDNIKINPNEAEKAYERLSLSVREYLNRQSVPQEIIERMFTLASTEIYWLKDEDLKSIGRRPAWWDQLLVDRCSADKKIDLDYPRMETGSPEARRAERHFHDVAVCAYQITEADRIAAAKLFMIGKD